MASPQAVRWCATVLVATACGRVEFSALTDAGTDTLPDGDIPSPLCNSVARFADDFEDNMDANSRWQASFASPGMTFAETGGAAVLTLASNSASAFAGYKTSRYYNLTGQRVWTEITQYPDPAAEVGIAVDFNPQTYVHLGIQNNMVRATQQVGAVYTPLGTVPYSTVNRFVGIREDAGMLVFETSPDGLQWEPFQMSPAPFDISSIQVTLFAGTSTAVASPGVARFGSLNGGVPQNLPACRVSTLVDHFDDGIIDRRWARTFAQSCCTVSEAGGEARLTSDGTVGFVAYRSAAAYSLTNDAFVFKVASDPPATSNAYAYAGLLDANNRLEIEVESTQISTWIDRNSVPANTNHPRMAGEVYFRIRHDAAADEVNFEASVDGVSWRTLRATTPNISIDDMEVALEFGTNTGTTPSQVSFDDVGGP